MKRRYVSRRLRRFLVANKAVSALEYAILLGIISVALAAALTTFSGTLSTAIDTIGSNVTSATSKVGAAPTPTP